MPPKAAANSFRHADRSPACPANELMPLTWIRRTNGLPAQPDNVVSQCKQYAGYTREVIDRLMTRKC